MVSSANPNIIVHEPKIKVDGITKYIQDTNFQFDNTFNENENSQDCWCTPDSLCDLRTGRMCGPNEAGNQLVCSHQRCPDVLSSDTIIKTCECTPRADIYGNDCNNDFCY